MSRSQPWYWEDHPRAHANAVDREARMAEVTASIREFRQRRHQPSLTDTHMEDNIIRALDAVWDDPLTEGEL